MSAVVVVGVVWLVLAPLVALLLGGAIRVADGERKAARAQRNFAVDGDPFAAPLPAAPVFETVGGPALRLALRVDSPFDRP